jgi:hypothetical protein
MIERKSGEFFERTPRTEWKLGIPPWMRRRRNKKEVKYVGELIFSCIESTAHIYCNKTYT